MSQYMGERQFYAQTYDASVPDWPGEIDFYREMATEVRSNEGGVLEVACGTGHVAIRLVQVCAQRERIAISGARSYSAPTLLPSLPPTWTFFSS